MKVKTTDLFIIICALGAARTMSFLNYLILGGCAIYASCRFLDWKEAKLKK